MEGVYKMEILLDKNKKERIEQLIAFVQNLTDDEVRDFGIFASGYMLAKGNNKETCMEKM